MLAEVKMHLNETDAVNYLNMVRERAGLPDYTGSNLRDAILQERRVELAFEGQSWYDLLRLYSHQELLSVMQKRILTSQKKTFFCQYHMMSTSLILKECTKIKDIINLRSA